MIKFNKYNVRDTETGKTAKIHYSVDNRIDGRSCVTLYAKEYINNLDEIFNGEVIDNTDIMTDYFEKGKVVLFENHPQYQAARDRATV